MPLPFPDDLPDWARTITYVIVAAGIGIAFLVARLGLLQGRKTPPAGNPGAAQVAAVIVDPTALNRLSTATEALDATLLAVIAVGKSISRANASAAAGSKAQTKAVGDLCEAIDRLREELIRAAAKIE
jgi:hypothetical protein